MKLGPGPSIIIIELDTCYTGFQRPLENLEYPGEKSSSWRSLKCPGILVN
jgi:hypothetical protein